jgi:hypothetical protein
VSPPATTLESVTRDALPTQYALRVVAAVARRPRTVPAAQEHALQRLAGALIADLRPAPVPAAPAAPPPGSVAGPGAPTGPTAPHQPGGRAELERFLQQMELGLWPWQRPSPPPVPGEEDIRALEAELARRLPETPEQAEEVEDLAASITASHRHLLDRITAGLKHADVAELTPWGLLVLVTWLLFALAGEPGPRSSNDLAVVAIVVAAAAIVQARK